MLLRPYQVECIEKSIHHLKTSLQSGLIVAATGAGKSIIISEIAKEIYKISNKKILILAPNVDLVKQNREKYLLTGNPASIFSASISKDTKHPIIFATPQSVKNSMNKFKGQFALTIIDESHGTTNTIKSIIQELQDNNPKMRLLGLTATPYRLNTGYIYKIGLDNKALNEDYAINPFYDKLIYDISARDLMDDGYLTPIKIGAIGEHYDTSFLTLNNMGKYNQSDLDRATLGQGRLTAHIVSDIVGQSQDKKGVMIFATSVKHGLEIMESLPKDKSRFIGGDVNMSKKERESIVNDFKKQKYKYLVNVATMTTGVDFTHCDCIAILRPTESISLLQQIIGRGLRLHENKKQCLLLDYAENIDRHSPDGNLFTPNIKTKFSKGEKIPLDVECPLCNRINVFSARKNEGGYILRNDGYFADLMGNMIEVNDKPLPTHYGRACLHDGCNYRWSYKVCESCNFENDIAARYCKKCKGELIDPNEKLILEFKALKKDPTAIQIDKVLDIKIEDCLSTTGNEVHKVTFITEFRNFTVWFMKKPKTTKQITDRDFFFHYHKQGIKTVEYRKKGSFYEIYTYNKEEQKCQVANI